MKLTREEIIQNLELLPCQSAALKAELFPRLRVAFEQRNFRIPISRDSEKTSMAYSGPFLSSAKSATALLKPRTVTVIARPRYPLRSAPPPTRHRRAVPQPSGFQVAQPISVGCPVAPAGGAESAFDLRALWRSPVL